MTKKERPSKVLIENFFSPSWTSPELKDGDLGFTDELAYEAGSTDYHEIFNYFVVESGLNLAFYYLEDGKCYGIHREDEPVEFFLLPIKKDWDGKYIHESCCWNTHDEGETICYVDNPKDLWDTLSINGKSLDYILHHSFIASLK